MRFHLELSVILLSFLFVYQGFCHTLPEKKIRTTRDTINIPTHLFKPLGETSENEDNSNRHGNGTIADPDDNVKLLERSSGGVETISEEDEEQEDDDRFSYIPPRQRFPPNSRMGLAVPDFSPIPSIDVDPRVPFPSRPVFGGNSWSSNNEIPRPIRPAIPSSLTPLYAGSQNEGPSPGFFGSSNIQRGRTFFRPNNPQGGSFYSPNGPGGGSISSSMGPLSSSNNFFRSESYSYTSDGNGPPQVERNVYDSRNGNGFGSSVRRNF